MKIYTNTKRLMSIYQILKFDRKSVKFDLKQSSLLCNDIKINYMLQFKC